MSARNALVSSRTCALGACYNHSVSIGRRNNRVTMFGLALHRQNIRWQDHFAAFPVAA